MCIRDRNYSIYDCYAISLDEEENLWFYYYDEFRLVRTNFKEDVYKRQPIPPYARRWWATSRRWFQS